MRSIKIAAIVSIAVLALVSCNRDPNVAKQRYLESGNKFYKNGKYKEARIKYMNALQKDMKFGPAYYGRGMAEYKLGALVPAILAFRRAKELIPEDKPEHWESMIRVSEILLLGARGNKEFLDEVKGYCDALSKHDPNSFDAHRLLGDWNFAMALSAASAKDKDQAMAMLDAAVAEYRKADTLKPGQAGVKIQLGKMLSGKGDFVGAEKEYREVIAQDKTLEAPYSDLYKLLLLQRKFPEAEQLLKDAYQANPKQYGYLSLLALHYSLQGRNPEMLSVLQQIKSHASDFPDAYILVGEFYLRLSDGDNAIKEYTEGIAKDPKRKLIYDKHIIEVLMRQGKRGEAAERNAAILKANPNDTDAKGLAATFLLEKGDVSRAISELQAVITKAPENAVARFQLGRAYFAQQQWEQARQMFQKAIELKADFLQAKLALATLQVTRGEYDVALNTANSVLAVDRNNLNAMLIESAALMGQKKYGDSRARLDIMAKNSPNSPDVYFQYGVLGLSEGKFAEAEKNFQKSYSLNPANSRGLIGEVETKLAQNKSEEAMQLLQVEADKSPNHPEYRIALAKTAARVGKYDVAITEYQKALAALDKKSRDAGLIYMQLGEVYRRKDNDVDAIASLQKAREILPENNDVLTTLGITLDHAGRSPEAKQVYEVALKIQPANGIALNNLAFLLAEHNGDLDEALTKGTRAKQLLPNLAEVSDTLGWIYLKKNLSDDAVKVFQGLVTDHPNQSTYRYHLAMALKQKGDKPRALKECQEALKNNPTKEEKVKIQDLLTRLSGA